MMNHTLLPFSMFQVTSFLREPLRSFNISSYIVSKATLTMTTIPAKSINAYLCLPPVMKVFTHKEKYTLHLCADYLN